MSRNYLIDTNVWLECLMDGPHTDETKLLLSSIPAEQLFISDLSLHIIGRACSLAKRTAAFTAFVNDLFIKNNVNRVSLDDMDYSELAELTDDLEFDYDDAWHYLIARSHDLVWTSLNTELAFEDTEIRTPAQALLDMKEMKN